MKSTLIVALLIIPIFFGSCNKEVENIDFTFISHTNKTLYGEWELRFTSGQELSSCERVTTQLMKDKTFQISTLIEKDDDCMNNSLHTGTWQTSQNTFVLNYSMETDNGKTQSFTYDFKDEMLMVTEKIEDEVIVYALGKLQKK